MVRMLLVSLRRQAPTYRTTYRTASSFLHCRRVANRDCFRMSSSFHVVKHTVNCHHGREYITATTNGDYDKPRLSVKQYIPHDNPDPRPGDITIIGAHANGFPKELYEPLWEEIHARAGRNGPRIRSIWIADMWNQGQSGVINEKILGHDPSWSDHARDLMSLINQKQDDMPYPIVGIGHSMGGTQLSLLSLAHPRLLHSLILLDPVIQKPNGSISPAILSTSRRDIWPSRSAAISRFQGSRFYQAWDPRVLERWIKHGLRDTPTQLYPSDDEQVTLATSKHQELFTFLRPTYRFNPADNYADKDPETDEEYPGYPFYRPEPLDVSRRLPHLRPSVQYIFGKESELSSEKEREDKMARTGTGVGGSGGAVSGRVEQVVLDCGHLVAMEKVSECADAIVEFLRRDLSRWRQERDALLKHYGEMSRAEQIKIDDRWRAEVNPTQRSNISTKL